MNEGGMGASRSGIVPEGSERLRLRVRGAVQGVGFRPFVYGLAQRFSLGGFVRNDAHGVVCEVEGPAARQLVAALRREAPPLGRIAAVDIESIAPTGERDFAILDSIEGRTLTRIVPDAATCERCLDDLFDAGSRFHRYPFVTCTNCGPRLTVSRRLPYDRPRTSMATFAMCPDCARDYHDPSSRRFHAETIACPNCGPRLSHGVDEIVAALRSGSIAAVKGIGGFHLMCDARNAEAVARLRQRKHRDGKPFALMVANPASAALVAEVDSLSATLLSEPSRPIVLMPMRTDAARIGLASGVAPGLTTIGVMLPYAPLHHLVFHAAAGAPSGRAWREAALDFVLVATSANPRGEPLVADDAEAQARLGGIADLVVTHDREIVSRLDDSVVGIIDGAPAFIRRARGFVPEPIELVADGPSVIAFGAHLKATVTITRGREAFVSQHVGDLSDAATARFFGETVQRLCALLDVTPAAAACDLHRDFHSTRCAEDTGLPLLRAQHHAAHIAAVAAEHHLDGDVPGVALDGYGIGPGGEAWGGELMVVNGHRWQRLGHLAPLALPGGDRAAREPWRMGVAALASIGRLADAEGLFPNQPMAAALARMIAAGCAQTTSMGRLFDAAAALLGTRLVQDEEAQAAMELEALAIAPRALAGGYAIRDCVLDFAPLLAALADRSMDAHSGAELFHGTVVAGVSEWIAAAARERGLERVALGGGCLLNRVLANGVAHALRRHGVTPLFARAVPANDGGLSLGQAHMLRAALAAGVALERQEERPCVSPFPPA
jgi:hydrogenase maturation protein HypF